MQVCIWASWHLWTYTEKVQFMGGNEEVEIYGCREKMKRGKGKEEAEESTEVEMFPQQMTYGQCIACLPSFHLQSQHWQVARISPGT